MFDTPELLDQDAARTDDLLRAARELDPARLGAADRTTLALFVDTLTSSDAVQRCHFERWRVSTKHNALVTASRYAGVGASLRPSGASVVVSYALQTPLAVDAAIDNLRVGLKAGVVADRESMLLVLADLDAELARPVEQSSLTAPARAPHPSWDGGSVTAFTGALHAAVEEQVRPALRTYQQFLRDELLPHARDSATPGLSGLPEGATCYAGLVDAYTDGAGDPASLAALGRSEAGRIEGELRAFGRVLFGTDDPTAIFERLRTDPALYFKDADEIESAAQSAVLQSEVGITRWFERRPKVGLEVQPVPAWWQDQESAGSYRPPSASGQSGTYYVNTSRPERRPRFEARALAFHEGVPGHHLQQSLQVKNTDLPAFRRFLLQTPVTEGWALYAEGLAEEMGLYKTELDRVGRLTMAALRAARLVVDTGLHAEGWSRAKAVDYLVAHTALSQENAAVEVERYLDWPGQALTYEVGEQAIWELRSRAEQALGVGFDIRAFHGVILGEGELTLPLLRERVEAWIATPPKR